MADSEQPKIIVDTDWKQQAQAEKQRLAAQAQASKPKPAAGAAPGARPDEEGGLPAADFAALVGTLLTPALHYLGAFPDPQTGRAIVSLEYARLYIDLLGVLEEKTKGNLTPEEARDLSQALAELRTRFVEISRAISAHLAKERAAEAGGAAGGGGGGGVGGMGAGGLGDLRITP